MCPINYKVIKILCLSILSDDNTVAQSDGCLIGDQEVTGSIPARLAKVLDHEIFSMVAESRKAVVSFWQTNAHKYLQN